MITALIDTREDEHHRLDLAPLKVAVATLTTGDYSVLGLEHVVALERKSLPDLLSCIGGERDRFEREVQRLLAFPHRCLVVEADWPTIELGRWRAKVTPAAVIGSLLGWQAAGLPVLLAGNHERAGRFASRWLFIAARRRWREARALVAGALDLTEADEGTA